MRLAVLSDIHGNLPALEAVIADLETNGADAVVNIGDCASGPLWPAETVRLLRTLNWPTVRGNHDRLISAPASEPLGRSDSWTRSVLDADARHWLGALPASLEIGGVLCIHGSPRRDDEFLTDEIRNGRLGLAPNEVIEARLDGSTASLVLCGHSHVPGTYRTPSGKTVMNPGSVGWPAYRNVSPPYVMECGRPHARYALIEFARGEIRIDHRSTEYDWMAAAARAERNGRIDWSHSLTTGTVS